MLFALISLLLMGVCMNESAAAQNPQEQALKIYASSGREASHAAGEARRLLGAMNAPSRVSDSEIRGILKNLDKPNTGPARDFLSFLKEPSDEEKARAQEILKSTEMGTQRCFKCGASQVSSSSLNEENRLTEGEKSDIDAGISPKATLSNRSDSLDKRPSLSQVIVFASFSLPDELLKGLSYACERAGARLVVRGLVNDSFAATKKRLDELGIAVDIDPPLFDEYRVTQVPAFLMTDGKKVDRLMGNVSLEYALEQIEEKGEVKGAGAYLTKLRSAP